MMPPRSHALARAPRGRPPAASASAEAAGGAAADAADAGAGAGAGAAGAADATGRSKRKVALFLGYCGAAYQGMQLNPGAKTVEAELARAIFEAGGITASNYGDIHKIAWTRAARTDKGVSALGQVVSAKLELPAAGEGRLRDDINARLPRDVRVPRRARRALVPRQERVHGPPLRVRAADVPARARRRRGARSATRASATPRPRRSRPTARTAARGGATGS